MMQKHLIDKVAGGGRRFLAQKLPEEFGVETPEGFFIRLSGAVELHSLAVQNTLKGRWGQAANRGDGVEQPLEGVGQASHRWGQIADRACGIGRAVFDFFF